MAYLLHRCQLLLNKHLVIKILPFAKTKSLLYKIQQAFCFGKLYLPRLRHRKATKSYRRQTCLNRTHVFKKTQRDKSLVLKNN